tara:strand:+ start:456 stop:746 length:291 start_codon:yes stop_codon:yes gene_type:complete
MARTYNNKALLMYLGIAVGLILFAVIIMTFLGNERRKKEVKSLRQELKEKFANHSPSPTHSKSHSPSHSPSLSPAEAETELNNLMNKLTNITSGTN